MSDSDYSKSDFKVNSDKNNNEHDIQSAQHQMLKKIKNEAFFEENLKQNQYEEIIIKAEPDNKIIMSENNNISIITISEDEEIPSTVQPLINEQVFGNSNGEETPSKLHLQIPEKDIGNSYDELDNLVEAEALKFLDQFEKEQQKTPQTKLKIKFNFKPTKKLSSLYPTNSPKEITIQALIQNVILIFN